MEEETQEKKVNLENLFSNLFQQTSGGGEEELLRIASTYSRQITGRQMRVILLLKFLANYMDEKTKNIILDFVASWQELKQYNNSALFVMRALDSISLRKFLGESPIKVNVEK